MVEASRLEECVELAELDEGGVEDIFDRSFLTLAIALRLFSWYLLWITSAWSGSSPDSSRVSD